MSDNKGKISEAAHLAAIVKSSGDAIITKDLNGVITSWNSAAEALFGYTPEEAIGQPVTILMPPERVSEEPGILSRIRSGETIEHYETIRLTKDGRLLDISLTVSPIHDESGRIVGASKIVRDVTDRRRIDAEIAKLAAIVENSSDAIISKDLDGVITSWNRGAETVFGYSAEEAIGRPVTMLMPPDRVDEEPGILTRIRRGESVDHYETVRVTKTGRRLEISLNVSPIRGPHGEIIGASKIARDITNAKRMEAAEREAHLMSRLAETQEGERKRIARDLHDQIGQYMTAMRLNLQGLLNRTEEAPEFAEELLTIKNLADRIDRDISFLTWQLRPTELEQLGLVDALKSFIDEWSTHTGIEAAFEYVGEVWNENELQKLDTNIYRIVQEALNNVAKHASASKVNVLMQGRNQSVIVMVEDNGRGFELTAARGDRVSGHGQGLLGMGERAELLGGTLDVESAVGGGTSVVLRVPLPLRSGKE